jgi:hypothetical protein
MDTTARSATGSILYLKRGQGLDHQRDHFAHVAVVWAKLDGVVRGFHRGAWGTPGFSAAKIEHKLSARGPRTPASSISITAASPRRTCCPGRPLGSEPALMCLNQARYGDRLGGEWAPPCACYEEGARPTPSSASSLGSPSPVLPARPAEARGDAHRDHQGAAALSSGWGSCRDAGALHATPRSPSPSATTSPWPSEVARQARDHPRGQRHHLGLSGHPALCSISRRVYTLRGHPPYPHAHPGARHHGDRSISLGAL